MAQIGLYRLGFYNEPPPHDHRTIIAPKGDRIFLLPQDQHLLPTEQLCPCPDCGGNIAQDPAAQIPWSRTCETCSARFLLEPTSGPRRPLQTMGGRPPYTTGRRMTTPTHQQPEKTA